MLQIIHDKQARFNRMLASLDCIMPTAWLAMPLRMHCTSVHTVGRLEASVASGGFTRRCDRYLQLVGRKALQVVTGNMWGVVSDWQHSETVEVVADKVIAVGTCGNEFPQKELKILICLIWTHGVDKHQCCPRYDALQSCLFSCLLWLS